MLQYIKMFLFSLSRARRNTTPSTFRLWKTVRFPINPAGEFMRFDALGHFLLTGNRDEFLCIGFRSSDLFPRLARLASESSRLRRN